MGGVHARWHYKNPRHSPASTWRVFSMALAQLGTVVDEPYATLPRRTGHKNFRRLLPRKSINSPPIFAHHQWAHTLRSAGDSQVHPNDNIPSRSRMSFPAATAVSSQVSHNGMEDRNLGSLDVLCVHSQGFDLYCRCSSQ